MSRKLFFLIAVILMVSMACNLPFLSGTPSTQAPPVPPALATDSSSTALPASTITSTNTAAVLHVIKPSDSPPAPGAFNYDVESSGTAPQHRAPYGDVYDRNLFERPFTQADMTYVPSLDIKTFQLSSDGTWYYTFVKLIGNNPNDPINIDYGIEIDKDKDGFGDVLIWAQPPYTTQWTTNGVKVYTDPNHDTGGLSPEKSDAPLTGDGYETVIFNQGQGNDPDLAWVRIDPKDSSMVEFAFKNSLAGPSFMWGAWADAGLKDPSKFNYNDRFTLAQAGSPIRGDPNYPIKAIYAMDNTCRAAFGFKPTGYEPLLCPPPEAPTGVPHAPKTPPQTPPQTPPPACGLSYPICISQGYNAFDQAKCSCYEQIN